jgi:predicted permease
MNRRAKRLLNDLDQEIHEHIELATQENIDRGMTPEEARYAALRKFGNVTRVKEDARDVWSIVWLGQLGQDIRFALRQLRKSPAFAAVAILTLALGIGANTAIFELLDAILLRALPIHNPEQLAEIQIAGGHFGMGLNQDYGVLTRPLFEEIRDKQEAFSGIFAWSVNQRYTGKGADMRPFKALWVSGTFFSVLGVQPWRGRLLQEADEGACPPTYAVVSYSYWQSVLGGRDLREGIKFIANNDLVEVVGVTPPSFFGMVVGDNFDIAFPFCKPPQALRRDVFEISVMGRIKPGWSIDRASTELAVLSPGIFEATLPPGRTPEWTNAYKNFRLAAVPAEAGVSELREYDHSLYLLLGISGLVLLIACANLANLMLARSTSRQSEIAVRLALGASRGRVVCHLLMESVLLATTGAVLGIALAQFLGRVLVWQISTEGNAVNLTIATDWRVLFFATTVAVFTCIVFGVAPAFRATRAAPLNAMRCGGRSTVGRERLSLQQSLVVTQIAVSLVLLVGALLFVRSFRNLMTFDPGIRESGITSAFLGFWQSNLPAERWFGFQQELLEEVQSLPGVQSAAITTNVPLTGQSWEHGVQVGSETGSSKFTWVSPDYFRTMNIPVLKGRGFTAQDTSTSPRVAAVNETFVRSFLAGVNPIGRTLRTEAEPGYPSTTYEIVGIIPDTRYSNLRDRTPPITFAPATQFPDPGPWTTMMIHSSLPTASLAAAAKLRLAEKHPDVLAEFFDFQRDIRDSLLQERLMAMLSGFFGALAALLTMTGVYGVISYLVVTRRNEIGIRMALGATRWNVVSHVMRRTISALGLGITIGIVLALFAARAATTLLYELKPNDLPTFVAAVVFLILVALAGSFLPARRASCVDPLVALKYE